MKNEVLFTSIHYNDPENFLMDNYGFKADFTPWKKAKALIGSLNTFYSKYSEKDIKAFQQAKNQRDKKEVAANWKIFGEDFYNDPQEALNQDKGYIYFLQCTKTKVVKIGKTISLRNRINQIKPQLPFKTKITHTIKTRNASILEELFHQVFQNKQLNGEWFELSKEDIQNIKTKNLPQNILDLIGE